MLKPKMKPTTKAEAKRPLRNSERSSRGWRATSWRRMNAAALVPPSASSSTMRSELQPMRWPLASPSSRATMAVTSSAKPGQSNAGRGLVSSRSGMKTRPRGRAAATPGRGIRNTQRQSKPSMAKPPSAGPNAGASTTPSPNNPIAVPRRSGGNTRNRICMESGCSSPPQAPCTTRERMTTSRLGAAAPAKDAAVKATRVAVSTARAPKWRTSQALSSMPQVMAAK